MAQSQKLTKGLNRYSHKQYTQEACTNSLAPEAMVAAIASGAAGQLHRDGFAWDPGMAEWLRSMMNSACRCGLKGIHCCPLTVVLGEADHHVHARAQISILDSFAAMSQSRIRMSSVRRSAEAQTDTVKMNHQEVQCDVKVCVDKEIQTEEVKEMVKEMEPAAMDVDGSEEDEDEEEEETTCQRLGVIPEEQLVKKKPKETAKGRRGRRVKSKKAKQAATALKPFPPRE